MNTNTVENIEEEIWKDIKLPYYSQTDKKHKNHALEGYQVSNLGRVRKYKRRKDEWKYLALMGKGSYLSFRIYELDTSLSLAKAVCLAFNGDKPADDEQYHVEHKDGNPLNNRADNLHWVSKRVCRLKQMSSNVYPINIQITVKDIVTNWDHRFMSIESACKFLGVHNSFLLSMVKNYKDIPYKNRYHVIIDTPERLFSYRRRDNRKIVFVNHYTGEVGEADCVPMASYMTGVRTRDISNRCRYSKTFTPINGYEFQFVTDQRPWTLFSEEEIIKSKHKYEVRLYGKTITPA